MSCDEGRGDCFGFLHRISLYRRRIERGEERERVVGERRKRERVVGERVERFCEPQKNCFCFIQCPVIRGLEHICRERLFVNLLRREKTYVFVF